MNSQKFYFDSDSQFMGAITAQIIEPARAGKSVSIVTVDPESVTDILVAAACFDCKTPSSAGAEAPTAEASTPAGRDLVKKIDALFQLPIYIGRTPKQDADIFIAFNWKMSDETPFFTICDSWAETCIIDIDADYRETIRGWRVDEDGNLIGSYPNGHDYPIAKDRLMECDWIAHMASKTWVDLSQFVPAYFKACMMAGIKKLTIELSGWDDLYKFEKLTTPQSPTPKSRRPRERSHGL